MDVSLLNEDTNDVSETATTVSEEVGESAEDSQNAGNQEADTSDGPTRAKRRRECAEVARHKIKKGMRRNCEKNDQVGLGTGLLLTLRYATAFWFKTMFFMIKTKKNHIFFKKFFNLYSHNILPESWPQRHIL